MKPICKAEYIHSYWLDTLYRGHGSDRVKTYAKRECKKARRRFYNKQEKDFTLWECYSK